MIKRLLKSQQIGSSMIEVLVTMIIISLGLLGQAAMIAHASKSNNAAFMRSQATLLSYDILERLRLNRALAVAGNFNVQFVTPGSDPSAAISGSTIDKNELRDWKSNIEQALPSGDGFITVDGSGNVTIKISWCEVVKETSCTNRPTIFITQSAI